MTTSPPLLTREELLPSMVTDADAFTALRYLRQREGAPSLWELESSGEKVLPGTPAVLADTYHALWSSEPSVKPTDQVPADRKYWRGMLEEMVKTSSFQELHAKTEGSSLMSLVGTIETGQTVLGLMPKGDQKKLEELKKLQEQSDELEEEAATAESEAAQIQALASEMQAAANASGQKGLSSGQAQKRANELAGQQAKAQANAKVARDLANQAKTEVDAKAEALMGKPGSVEAEQKLRELARIGHAALAATQKKVEALSETIQGWGLDAGELSRMAMPEAVGLLEKMRRNAAFKKFSQLLGRLRAIAAKKAKSKTEGEGRRIARQETGRDIARAYPSELVAFAHPATRVQALLRWSRGEMRLQGQETRKRLGHGPVIVCEDGSGSMEGAKQQWAKGVTLALAHFAKLQHRGYGWVHFGATHSKLVARSYSGGKMSAAQILEVAELFLNASGTDFEVPLRRAVEMIEREGLKKADIVLVTDGDCDVSEGFLQWFLATKKRLELNVIAVICDVGGHVTDATVKKFSDRVERASSFTAEEAEAKVFAHL